MNKPYILFLDDERFPGRGLEMGPEIDIVVSRSVEDAKRVVASRGEPFMISFDHDLGEGVQSGYDFAHWLVEMHLDKEIDIKDMHYYVHSANPVGRNNIVSLLERFARHLSES